jgi:Holliday junction DNA helicase RuvA
MIASIHGIVQQMDESSIVLEVAGVGFRILIPASVQKACPGIGKSFLLHTQMIVREDAIHLYGFLNPEQRELFNTLLKVDGVGPRSCLAILSHLSPEALQKAVAMQQPELLTTVPGVGPKTAEKIIFYLKDRIKAPVLGIGVPSEIDIEVLTALTSLGYSLLEAQAALKSIPTDAPEDIEERIRMALQYFVHS